MGDVVNLRRARKAKAREETSERAAENRISFGRTKAEREATARERERALRKVDDHRRERGPDPTADE